jgi:hypothetical protein
MALACAAAVASRLPPCRALDVEDVIRELEAHEELYRDLEVKMRREYQSFHEPWRGQLFSGGTVLATASEVCEIHGVMQQGMFRFDLDARAVVGPERKQERQRSTRRFDGAISRVWMQDMKVANIIDEPSYERFTIRPHMLVYTSQSLPYALSTLLRGQPAIDATPAYRHRGPYPAVELTGPEQQNGLPCHVVTLRFVPADSTTPSRVERLWLAIDRNLLPVRFEEYMPKVSATVPDHIATIEEMREIEPGIWFPTKVVATHFKRQVLQQTGRQEPGWRSVITVQFVRLDPQYPASYFNTLEIPEGTYVYHVREQKIVRSYVQGAPGTVTKTPGKPARCPYWLWIGAAVLAVVGCTLGINALARRVRRARHAAG